MILSVISIAYNNLPGLRKTLEPFENHPFQGKIELIVVDGGSQDGTSEFLQSSHNIQQWVSEPDHGIYNAMNKGLRMATGDYVWFLNSGDYLYDIESLKNLMDSLKENPDAAYAETMMVNPSGVELGPRSEITTRKLPDNLNWKSLRYGMNVGHQSFVIKRSLCPEYNELFKYVSDIDWMITALKNCKKVVKLPGYLACFTLEGFSSSNRSASNKERFKVLQSHYGLIPNLLNHLKIVVRKILNRSKL